MTGDGTPIFEWGDVVYGDEYNDVPWSEMAGMRDKLSHGCADIDLRIVWQTTEEEIPALEPQIESIRAEIAE